MAVIVGTDSYVSEVELNAYAVARGVTLTGDLSILLIKAMDYLETRNFIGIKSNTTQPLQWPRLTCNYGALCEWGADTVPAPIKNAQMVAAILVFNGHDLQPVLGRVAKREKVDVLEVEYADNSPLHSQFLGLQDILRPFLHSGIRGERV